MTFLELVNAVLTRLREDTIIESQFNSDPYYRSIASNVNDAKSMVEDAWQWGALRATDELDLLPGQLYFACPGSDDNHYILKRILVKETGNFLRWITVPMARTHYAQLGTGAPAPLGQPAQFASAGVVTQDKIDNNVFIPNQIGEQVYAIYPLPDKEYTLEIDRCKHQAKLEAPTDRLLVPSLPVYSLATALASRERGEVGGTPTSELFKIGDSHLSNAIAQDSARYADELDWFSAADGWINTNLSRR